VERLYHFWDRQQCIGISPNCLRPCGAPGADDTSLFPIKVPSATGQPRTGRALERHVLHTKRAASERAQCILVVLCQILASFGGCNEAGPFRRQARRTHQRSVHPPKKLHGEMGGRYIVALVRNSAPSGGEGNETDTQSAVFAPKDNVLPGACWVIVLCQG